VDPVALLVVIAVICAVIAIVAAPLRRRPDADAGAAGADRLAELEARKEAKYREIRDAEMDFKTGKLSEADHRALDRQLRAEAMEVLHAIDEET
jgi:flagellar biosynthesis/type III secretory pathway M-ring protein FliF/YscJ